MLYASVAFNPQIKPGTGTRGGLSAPYVTIVFDRRGLGGRLFNERRTTHRDGPRGVGSRWHPSGDALQVNGHAGPERLRRTTTGCQDRRPEADV